MIPVVDVHCHVYPAVIADKAAKAVADFYQVQPGEGAAEVAGLPEVLQKECVGRYNFIHSVATVPHQVQSVNRFVAGVAALDKRFLALGTLNPYSTPLEMEENIAQLEKLGLPGVKIHPDMQQFPLNGKESLAMLEACENRFVILAHTGDVRYHFSNPSEFAPVLKRFPRTTFIGAHMAGYTCWEEATKKLAGRFGNLYVDLSSTMFALPPEKCVELIRAYGADRVLFGSDFPMWRPQKELERFLALPLTKQEQEMILYRNAAKLFKLPSL